MGNLRIRRLARPSQPRVPVQSLPSSMTSVSFEVRPVFLFADERSGSVETIRKWPPYQSSKSCLPLQPEEQGAASPTQCHSEELLRTRSLFPSISVCANGIDDDVTDGRFGYQYLYDYMHNSLKRSGKHFQAVFQSLNTNYDRNVNVQSVGCGSDVRRNLFMSRATASGYIISSDNDSVLYESSGNRAAKSIVKKNKRSHPGSNRGWSDGLISEPAV